MSQIINRAYDTYAEAVTVIRELEAADISHNDIAIVANNVDSKNDPTDKDAAKKGAEGGAAAAGAIGAGAGLLAGLGMLAIPGVGPVVAAGWLVSAAAGAAVGATTGAAAGGIIGKLTEHKVPKDEADAYVEIIRRGGALVSAKTDDKHFAAAEEIMNRTRYVDIAARSQAYRTAEWRGYDEKAPIFTPAQIVEERNRYL